MIHFPNIMSNYFIKVIANVFKVLYCVFNAMKHFNLKEKL